MGRAPSQPLSPHVSGQSLAGMSGTLTGRWGVCVVHAAPVRALIDAAQGADVLVVGARGRGGFAGLLLGSVSDQVTHHAPCPVTVVRSDRKD